MSLSRPGPWQLRFLIVDKDTSLLSYLTSNGVGKVATVEPEEQPSRQTWFAFPVEGKKDFYTIIQEPASECPPGLAQAEDSDEVILSSKPGEWRLQYVPIDIANGDVYEVHSTELIGAIRLLGKKGDKAVIETFVVGAVIPTPAWQFLVKPL